MSRIPVVVGNWKMELSHKASIETASSFKKLLAGVPVDFDIVLCPSYPVLPTLQELLAKSDTIQLGAQNVHWEEKGPWTGHVSVTQITPFVRWCIIGHSEQRATSHETDDTVQVKANLLLRHGITPIVCIGETATQRAQEQTVEVISAQVATLFNKLTRISLNKLVIAYEPIWAIGSGQTPDPADVAQIMLLIRRQAAERFGREGAEKLRIIYGGSVNADNVLPFISEPGVDGVLVGGASIHPLELIGIIKAVKQVHA